MENQIDKIDKEIEALKKSIEKRFEKKAEEIKTSQEVVLAQYSAQLINEKEKLLKELDDRLAIIKEFPSILDADLVSIKQFERLDRINFEGPRYDTLYMNDGKWKVLILAKKL